MGIGGSRVVDEIEADKVCYVFVAGRLSWSADGGLRGDRGRPTARNRQSRQAATEPSGPRDTIATTKRHSRHAVPRNEGWRGQSKKLLTVPLLFQRRDRW